MGTDTQQNPNPDDAWFQGFATAPMSSRGSFLAAGVYILRVKANRRHISNNAGKGTKGHQMFIAELEVMQVIAAYPEDRPDPNKPAIFAASNKAGEKAAWIQNVSKNPDTALGNVKGYLYAVRGSMELAAGVAVTPEHLITPDDWKALILDATKPPGDTCAGTLVKATVTRTFIAKTGAPFCPVAWEAYAPPAAPSPA